jgi:hypothetical protein
MYKQHYAIKHQLIARQQMLLVGIMGIKKAGVIAPAFISLYLTNAMALRPDAMIGRHLPHRQHSWRRSPHHRLWRLHQFQLQRHLRH